MVRDTGFPKGERMTQERQGRQARPLRAACAALVAAATLAGGGLVAGQALAGGGAGNAGGGVPTGTGQMYLTWRYQDNNDGGFGSSTDANSVRRALLMDWPRLEGKADQWINEALNEANANCVARYNEAHHDGQAQCRVVAVGAVGAKSAAGNQFGYEAGADHSIWMNAWNQLVKANGPYHNNGSTYNTDMQFNDQAGWSVDRLADEYAPTWANGTSTGTIVVIALNQYEPLPPDYDLGIGTQASGRFTQAGSTGTVSDAITLSGGTGETINGNIVLHWVGVDGDSCPTTHIAGITADWEGTCDGQSIQTHCGDDTACAGRTGIRPG